MFDITILFPDKSQKNLDDADVLVVLQALYTMTFNPQGRDAFVYVLGLDDNVNIFLPFIQITGEFIYWVFKTYFGAYIICVWNSFLSNHWIYDFLQFMPN